MDLDDLEHNTARRDPHRLGGRHLDRRRVPASAACATTAAGSASAPAARGADPAAVPAHVPRPQPAGRGRPRARALLAARRRAARDRPPRRARPRVEGDAPLDLPIPTLDPSLSGRPRSSRRAVAGPAPAGRGSGSPTDLRSAGGPRLADRRRSRCWPPVSLTDPRIRPPAAAGTAGHGSRTECRKTSS